MTDSGTLLQILGGIAVDEIYHLAAQSHVGVSFEAPLLTCDINALGTLRLLEVLRILNLQKKVKFYSVRKIRISPVCTVTNVYIGGYLRALRK
jgi:GDPmannose 4,6-dehydratase